MTALRAASDSSRALYSAAAVGVHAAVSDEVAHGGRDEHDGQLPLMLLRILVFL